MLTYKHRLLWINDKHKEKEKQHAQKRRDSKYANKYKDLKGKVQTEQKEAYWKYI